MAKELFLVPPPPVMPVEWTIPRLQVPSASQGGKSQPLLVNPPATGSPAQPGTGGAWASAVQAFFCDGGVRFLNPYQIEGQS